MIVIEREEEIEAMKIFMAKQRSIGLDVRLLSGDEARELEPALARHIAGATVSDSDAQVNPMQLLFAYAHAPNGTGPACGGTRPSPNSSTTAKGTSPASSPPAEPSAPEPSSAAPASTPRPRGASRPRTARHPPTGTASDHRAGRAPHRSRHALRPYIAAKYHPELLEGSQDETVRLGVGLALEQTREEDCSSAAPGSSRASTEQHLPWNLGRGRPRNARIVPA